MNTVNFTAAERKVLLFAIGQEIVAHIHVVLTSAIPVNDQAYSIFKAVSGFFELRTILLYTTDGTITVSDVGLQHLAQIFAEVDERYLPASVLLDVRSLRETLTDKLVTMQTPTIVHQAANFTADDKNVS